MTITECPTPQHFEMKYLCTESQFYAVRHKALDTHTRRKELMKTKLSLLSLNVYN